MPSEMNAEELADSLNLVRSCLYNGDNAADTKALDDVCAAAEAHLAQLRAPKDELAEAVLGAVDSAFRSHSLPTAFAAAVIIEVELLQDEVTAAIRDALTKARATGGDRG